MNTAFVSIGLILFALAQDERNLSPKEATAADQADFRGIGEAILGGRQWSPFMNWTPPRLDIDTLGGLSRSMFCGTEFPRLPNKRTSAV